MIAYLLFSIVTGLLAVSLAFHALGWLRGRKRNEPTRDVPDAGRSDAADPLTGLLTRAAMIDAARRLLARETVMLVIDIDGFKAINEQHGHLAGDTVLRTAADAIRAETPLGALLARVGADSFAAAFPFADKAGLEVVARAVLRRIGQPGDLGGDSSHVSASIGIARSEPGDTVDALLRRAGIAMRSAKAAGTGGLAWFDDSMRRELAERNAMEAGLRAGIPGGEIVPYFEPQIDLASRALQGFEMLARWQRPDGSLVAPNDFIPVAEECGLIADLSLSVMRQAMAEARGWDSGLTLSVNISPIQLKDPWLAHKIAKLLNETGFPAERLEVEITERSLFEDLDLAHAIVTSLKNQGIRLALDDFGTGYSSLAHLRALPFDRIKIDRSFVTSINDSADSAAIVTAITRLAESLNLAVTAEGIEDEAVETRLRAIANYTGQGWLFGKPMQVEEVRAQLAAKGLLPAARHQRVAEVPNVKLRRAG